MRMRSAQKCVLVITLPSVLLLFLFSFNINHYVFGYELFSKGSSPNNIPYKDWVANWWNWWISVPKSKVDNFQGCVLGESNNTILLMNPVAGEITNHCTISSEHPIVLTSLTGECDTGTNQTKLLDYPELLTCAIKSDQSPVNMGVTIDGISLDNLSKYEIKNEHFTINIPPDNWYQTDPGVFKAAGHGYFVFLKPLTVGTHTIEYSVHLVTDEVANDFAGHITYFLTIVPPRK